MMKKWHEEKILCKLMDPEQEMAEMEMLEKKGNALRELLED